MNFFLVILMYAMWSSIFAFAKIALDISPPLFLTAARMLFAAFFLLGYLVIRKSSFRLPKRQLLTLVLLAVFSIYLTNLLEFWALQYLTAAKTCFIYSLSPFFAALFSYLHFKETLNLRKCLGMLIGFLGFVPLLATQKGASELLTTIPFFSWPEIAMMGAAMATAYGWILLRLIVNPPKTDTSSPPLSPLMANGMSMLLGGFMALSHSYFVDAWDPIPIVSGKVPQFVEAIMIMTLISNIFCYNLYGFLLKKFTATFLSFMGLLSPVFASLSSWILLGEQPSVVILTSTGVVSLGLWMIYSSELKQGYYKKENLSLRSG